MMALTGLILPTWLDSLHGVSFTSMLTAAGTSEGYRISDITASNLLTATHYDDYIISQYGLKSGSSSSLID